MGKVERERERAEARATVAAEPTRPTRYLDALGRYLGGISYRTRTGRAASRKSRRRSPPGPTARPTATPATPWRASERLHRARSHRRRCGRLGRLHRRGRLGRPRGAPARGRAAADANLPVRAHLEYGAPAKVLLAYTSQAELLVLGGRRPTSRHVPGAVVRACLRSSACPVVVIGPGKPPGGYGAEGALIPARGRSACYAYYKAFVMLQLGDLLVAVTLDPLLNRETEIRRLEGAWSQGLAGQPQLAVIWGRRRVGKTFLLSLRIR